MKLLADENIDFSVILRLREAGHEVIAVAELAPGIPDEEVMDRANAQAAMLLTEDKDFGELAFRQFLIHHGVLIRLAGLPSSAKADLLINFLETHGEELLDSFVVVSPGMVRIRRRYSA
jgi:predicted nuclease of predicted toxin-antitoxin system